MLACSPISASPTYDEVRHLVRRNVPPGALAVSGGPQRNLAGWVQSERSGTSQAEAAESAQASDRGPGRAGGDQGEGD